MNKLALAVVLLLGTSGAVLATGNETKPSDDETASITATLDKFGCKVDKNPIVKEDDGAYEIDDAMCDGMPYDVKLDTEFHLTSLTMG